MSEQNLYRNPDSSIMYLKGVGPNKASAFNLCGISTIRDLIFYFPRKHLDRSQILPVISAMEYVREGYDGEITLIGTVLGSELKKAGAKKFLIVKFEDQTGSFDCLWFQGVNFFENKFKPGEIYAVSKKPAINKWGNLTFTHPDLDKIDYQESVEFNNTGKIIPFYSIPQQLKEKSLGDTGLRKLIALAIDLYIESIPETLPSRIIKNLDLLDLKSTIKNYHFPSDFNALHKAIYRLKFEELFYFSLVSLMKLKSETKDKEGIICKVNPEFILSFLNSLPFKLTNAQLKVLTEIRSDLESGRVMSRLIQGDVGSGKTLVALLSILIVIDNGYQAILMAPTEILAIQHYNTILNFLKIFEEKSGFKVAIEVLTGSTTKKEKKRIYESISQGETKLIIGTHAIFEEPVIYKNPGLIIIDEQHRFGVDQRAKLIGKGTNPHTLVMSATPIPRTITLTVYGDLNVSIIDELPPGRTPVQTILRGEEKLPAIFRFLEEQAASGYQSYIVFPLVEESEKLELKAAVTEFENITKNHLPNLKLGLLHGKMNWKEKELVMRSFKDREFDVLIATTVIEVGIDVPNATIMLVNEAHRFGLSQLHQLRGRVGRGADKSYCLLVTKEEIVAASNRIKGEIKYLSPVLMERFKSLVRLKAMTETNDGFKIAEIDLKMRGPGDIYGTKQSGMPEFKFADIESDYEIIIKAREVAEQILKNDPKLESFENKIIKNSLYKYHNEGLKYFNIG